MPLLGLTCAASQSQVKSWKNAHCFTSLFTREKLTQYCLKFDTLFLIKEFSRFETRVIGKLSYSFGNRMVVKNYPSTVSNNAIELILGVN